MSCKIEKNKSGKITGVLNQDGKPSTLFQQLFNIPTFSLMEAIDTYKNIYSDKLKNSVKFQVIDEEYKVIQRSDLTPIANQAVEVVTDENGFDWYEVKITPEDTQKPVVAFQMSNAEITSKVNNYLTKINKAKKENPQQYWSVDTPSYEEVKEAVENDRLVDVNGGMGLVNADGNMIGIFKYDNTKKGTAQSVQEASILKGGIKLDNYDGYLTKLYENNGFRVVSRLKFNEEAAPEDWNKQLHGTPDVVFMIYDKDNALTIKEEVFDTYKQAQEYRDSFVEEAKKSHPFYRLSQNNTGKTQAFFSDVVEGKSEKYKAKKEWTPLLSFTQAQQFFKGIYDRFKGNFDNHIATSIPTFRETQIKVGATLIKMLQSSSSPLIYDIGGSEGGFVKAITQASNGSIKSINLDVNDSMEAVHNATPVEGSSFIKEAFYEEYIDEDTGVTYKKHVPKQKADVVHESMVFQFISPERGQFVKEVKDNYLKEDGVLLLEEKLVPETQEEWSANEELKDSYKRQFYSQAEITEKQEEILTGMLKNQTKVSDLLRELNKNFDYVGQYWNAGNFKGYIATNSKENYNTFLNELGGVISFAETQLIEPSPTFNGLNSYAEAINEAEEVKVEIDGVLVATISSEGAVNDLIKQNIIEDRRELQPDGDIIFKTKGSNLTMKIVNANIAKEVLGGRINKAGDIRTPQKQEVEVSDDFKKNKKELGNSAALAILASDALANNTPTFGAGRIITEEIEIPTDNAIMSKIKSLLSQLGIKTISIEQWEEITGDKATVNALADIANKLIAFADGTITEDALSEEFAHFIIEALDQEQIAPLLEIVHKTDEWKEYASAYMDIYKDEAVVRREILGKVLKNALQKKQQQTLQGKSVADRVLGFLNNLISKIRNILNDSHRQQLENFTDDIYNKLMAEELYEEMTPEQFDGNKLVMFQTQMNDTVHQSITKLATQMGVIDRRLNSSQKVSLKQIEDNLENADEAMQLEAVAGLASVLKKHVNYLNTRGKRQGFLSTEETFVYNTTEDIGKALQAIVPKLEDNAFSVFKNRKEKAVASAKDAISALNELTANLNEEKEGRFEELAADLMEQNGLTQQQKDILLKELRTQSRDTNIFYSWFGGVIHAQNSVLNMLAKRVSKMHRETEVEFSKESNALFTAMNALGFKDEQVASLMKKWARGGYLFSPYDFTAEERDSNKIRLGVIKKEAQDVYDEYLKELGSEDKVFEHFSKNQDEWLTKLNQEQSSNYRFLVKEEMSNSGLRLDALSKEERDKFNTAINKLNLSLKTKKLLQEFKDKKNQVFRKTKQNNGFSEEDLQQLQEINSEYQMEAEPYNSEGTLKDGLFIDDEGKVRASVPKGDLDPEVRTTLELNEYREALKEIYGGNERNAFKGFFDQLQEAKRAGLIDAESFVRLNTRIFYTDEFWQQSNSNDSIVTKLREMDTDESNELAKDIDNLNRKLKNILKKNKLYNRPSQIDYENMSGAEEREIKDLVKALETKFREAKKELPKEESQSIERAFKTVTNDAYRGELLNRGYVENNENISDEELQEKITFIREHVTDDGMRAIYRMMDRVRAFEPGKNTPKGLYVTEEEILENRNKVILDYAESKLMPYFKTLLSKQDGAEMAESNLISEMIEATSSTELETVYNKYKNEYFIDASPSFIFEDADTSTRLNKEYKKKLENNEPLLSDKYLNKEFFDYFGINPKDGFSIDTAVSTKNQKEFEAWKATVGFQEKALEYANMKGKHNKYLLPQYRRGTFARAQQIATGISKEKIKEAFKDIFTYREDDPAMGQTSDGEIAQLYQKNSLVIPKTGFRRLESDQEVTDELLYSYMLMMRESVKYKKRTEAWADAEAMEHYIKGKTYGDKEGEASNTYKMFNDFKRYNIYGQREVFKWETDMYGLLPKKYNLAPAVNFFQSYVRNNNLAYSILTPMTSFLQGTTNFFVENLVGDRINKDAARLAASEMPRLMTEASSEFFNVRAKSKLNLLLQFMGQDSPSERFDNSNYGKALRGMSIYKSGYLSHYLGDVPIQAQTTLTVLHDYRIVNGDLLDYNSWRRKNRSLTEKQAHAEWKKFQDDVLYKHIIPTKDGSMEVDQAIKDIDGWENKIQQVRDKLTIAKQDIDNQISDGDKGMVQRHAMLSWTTLHKGWLVTSMTKRFKEQHLNLFNNMMEEGTYRGTFYFVSNMIKDLKKKGLKNAWKENFKGYDGGYTLKNNIIYDDKNQVFKTFTDVKEAQEYYEELKYDFSKMRQISVTRAGIDLLLTSLLATLGIMLSKMADDDDDDYVKEFVAYATYRLASEVSSQSAAFPAQAYAFLESPTVGMSQLQNSLDVLDIFDNEEIKRGTYRGYSRQQAWFLKALPGFKEAGKLYNIDRTRNSFVFYNAKNLKFTAAGMMLLED